MSGSGKELFPRVADAAPRGSMLPPTRLATDFWRLGRVIGDGEGCLCVHPDAHDELIPRPLSIADGLLPDGFLPDRSDTSSVRVWAPPATPALPRGEPLAFFADRSPPVPAVVRCGETIHFAFDPGRSIDHVLRERYYQRRRPLYTYLPVNYHRLIPPSLRAAIRFAGNRMAKFAAYPRDFPAWPIETSIEALRLLVASAARLIGKTPIAPTWPHGKRYAVAVTVDVDGPEGQREISRIAHLADRHQAPLAWYLPSHRYALDHGLLVSLTDRGHEIGSHDWNHDNRTTFLSPRAIRDRLHRCMETLARHGVVGYRSPSLMRSPELFASLTEAGFDYDTSIGDTERLLQCAPASGCGSVFPFLLMERGSLLEIPCSIPLDVILAYMGYPTSSILELWRRKREWIRTVGGVAVFTLHADPHIISRSMRDQLLERLLPEISEDPEAWVTTPAAIASHWRTHCLV